VDLLDARTVTAMREQPHLTERQSLRDGDRSSRYVLFQMNASLPETVLVRLVGSLTSTPIL